MTQEGAVPYGQGEQKSTKQICKRGASALAVLVLAGLPVFPKNATPTAPGCGAPSVQFDVKTTKSPRAMDAADSSKAIIYFLQDDRYFFIRPRPTVRFGIDGEWVGATHGDSYFQITVKPGEHHLCAGWQPVDTGSREPLAALHFTAEAGKAYYFRARDFWDHRGAVGLMELESVDSDEARLLISGYSYSTSRKR